MLIRYMLKFSGFIIVALFVSSCASYGVIENEPLNQNASHQSYSIKKIRNDETDVKIILAFSGGGTRAAALAYGVMEALHEISVDQDEPSARSLLDEVQVISSVSGGSFTSAYYGLYGNRIFEDFKTDFLLRDIDSEIIFNAMNPLFWFGSTGRTELAVDIYEKYIFHGKTFADMNRPDAPLIIINATDLGNGIRFSFLQEYFNLLCSDLSTFPVARAVAASSAVPVLFNPIVVETYPESCKQNDPAFLEILKYRDRANDQVVEALKELQIYIDKKSETQYVHFVDGGITDNLGLRAGLEIIEASGGAKSAQLNLLGKAARQIMVISVDASTKSVENMNDKRIQPSVGEVISVATDVQLLLYNRATYDLMETGLDKWAKEISTPQNQVTPYFVKVEFKSLQKNISGIPKFLKINRIPTNFSLTEDQVEKLIQTGRELLLENPEFKRFLEDRADKFS
ncbi:MAG: patatin-like phospholipase family protein [Sneathiella sp.]|uniref:patatin-like phospholipase family protein n=1 Tax=Sneathiella sp. TaxID=1964365 RepID=UPI00300108C8